MCSCIQFANPAITLFGSAKPSLRPASGAFCHSVSLLIPITGNELHTCKASRIRPRGFRKRPPWFLTLAAALPAIRQSTIANPQSTIGVLAFMMCA